MASQSPRSSRQLWIAGFTAGACVLAVAAPIAIGALQARNPRLSIPRGMQIYRGSEEQRGGKDKRERFGVPIDKTPQLTAAMIADLPKSDLALLKVVDPSDARKIRKYTGENSLQVAVSGKYATAVLSRGEGPGGDRGISRGSVMMSVDDVDVPLTRPQPNGRPPGPVQGWMGTDNDIVKAKDGSLVAIRSVVLWEGANPKPAWWDKVQVGTNQKGSRVVLMVWRSADGTKWRRVGTIDPLNYENGRYAVPRPKEVKEEGCPDGCFGGWDRPELYADPFTGDLWASCNGTGGPDLYSEKQDKNGVSTQFIFKSTDGGATWKEVGTFPMWTPVTMTSTADGRVFFSSCVDKSPLIWFTTKNQGSDVSIAGPFDVRGTVSGKKIDVGVDASYGDVVYKATNSVSRITSNDGTSRIRMTYPVLTDKGRTGLMVVRVEASGAGAPKVSTVDLVRGKDGRNVYVSQFIEADRTAAGVANTDVALLYWIEGNKDYKGVARASIFRGPKNSSSPFDIGKEHNPVAWSGHYAKGGSFAMEGKVHFVPQWCQSDGVYINRVSVTP